MREPPPAADVPHGRLQATGCVRNSSAESPELQPPASASAQVGAAVLRPAPAAAGFPALYLKFGHSKKGGGTAVLEGFSAPPPPARYQDDRGGLWELVQPARVSEEPPTLHYEVVAGRQLKLWLPSARPGEPVTLSAHFPQGEAYFDSKTKEKPLLRFDPNSAYRVERQMGVPEDAVTVQVGPRGLIEAPFGFRVSSRPPFRRESTGGWAGAEAGRRPRRRPGEAKACAVELRAARAGTGEPAMAPAGSPPRAPPAPRPAPPPAPPPPRRPSADASAGPPAPPRSGPASLLTSRRRPAPGPSPPAGDVPPDEVDELIDPFSCIAIGAHHAETEVAPLSLSMDRPPARPDPRYIDEAVIGWLERMFHSAQLAADGAFRRRAPFDEAARLVQRLEASRRPPPRALPPAAPGAGPEGGEAAPGALVPSGYSSLSSSGSSTASSSSASEGRTGWKGPGGPLVVSADGDDADRPALPPPNAQDLFRRIESAFLVPPLPIGAPTAADAWAASPLPLPPAPPRGPGGPPRALPPAAARREEYLCPEERRASECLIEALLGPLREGSREAVHGLARIFAEHPVLDSRFCATSQGHVEAGPAPAPRPRASSSSASAPPLTPLPGRAQLREMLLSMRVATRSTGLERALAADLLARAADAVRAACGGPLGALEGACRRGWALASGLVTDCLGAAHDLTAAHLADVLALARLAAEALEPRRALCPALYAEALFWVGVRLLQARRDDEAVSHLYSCLSVLRNAGLVPCRLEAWAIRSICQSYVRRYLLSEAAKVVDSVYWFQEGEADRVLEFWCRYTLLVYACKRGFPAESLLASTSAALDALPASHADTGIVQAAVPFVFTAIHLHRGSLVRAVQWYREGVARSAGVPWSPLSDFVTGFIVNFRDTRGAAVLRGLRFALGLHRLFDWAGGTPLLGHYLHVAGRVRVREGDFARAADAFRDALAVRPAPPRPAPPQARDKTRR
eukprot:tig00021168_g19117.t1